VSIDRFYPPNICLRCLFAEGPVGRLEQGVFMGPFGATCLVELAGNLNSCRPFRGPVARLDNRDKDGVLGPIVGLNNDQ
jgi:hypothetical protein